MKQGTRETLLMIKPKLTPVEIQGEQYFLRELSVGEANKELYGQRAELIKIAQAQGIELDMGDELALTTQLRNVYDPYKLARSIAQRLCDEQGNRLFDPENQTDLDQIRSLDGSVMGAINKVLSENAEKNLPSVESSK